MSVRELFDGLHRAFRRHVLCRLGLHGNPPDANFCQWGCGHVFNPDAFQTWVVTLKSGETFEVKAINSYHAGSVVMYGGASQIAARSGRPLALGKVHRDNIVSAVLRDGEGETPSANSKERT